MLEIDVDIGRLVARVGDEALEKQVRARGIDLGDAERIADGGIGGRAAALVEDALLARIAHDVLDGEEKRRVFEPRDQLELVLDLLDHRSRRPAWIAPLQPFPGQPFEACLRGLAVGRDLIGIFVGQLFEVEIAAAGKLHRVRDRFGIGGEEAGHLLGAFEMALGVAGEAEARFVDGAGVADAGEHILKAAAGGIVIEHIVGGEEGHARRLGQRCEPVQPLGIAALKAAGGGKIDAALEMRRQTGQMRLKGVRVLLALKHIVRRDQGRDLAFRKGEEILEGKMTLAFGNSPLWLKTPSPRPSPQGERGKELRSFPKGRERAPLPQAGGQFGRPLSPWGERQSEGGLPSAA